MNSMDTGVIIALIFGIASLVSSICFGFIPGFRKIKIEKLERKVQTMAQDIDSFYAIEQSLLDQLSIATGRNSETLKKETRSKIKQDKGRALSNYAKPSGIAPYI